VKLGIVGGLSPYSTILYYKFIVEAYRERTGRDPELVIYSVPIQEFASRIRSGDLEGAARLLSRAFQALESSGANLFLIGANTPHAVLDRYDGLSPEGFLDIREAVVGELVRRGYKRVGLLATNGTLRYGVYDEWLDRAGIEMVTPSPRAQQALMSSIEALARGDIGAGAKAGLAQALMDLVSKRVDAVVYACTELSLIADRVHVRLPVVDSLTVHALRAVEALTGGSVAEAREA